MLTTRTRATRRARATTLGAMDWGANDDVLGALGGARNFLEQLQAEQFKAGVSAGNMGAFEADIDDELAPSELSSESDLGEDDDIAAAELLDLDDDEIREKMSWIMRIKNRYSKPRYLKYYFVIALICQLSLYVALFVVQSVIGDSTQTILLIVVAAMLTGAQASQGASNAQFANLAVRVTGQLRCAQGNNISVQRTRQNPMWTRRTQQLMIFSR